METTEAIRVWLCDCGRIHIESRHLRRSFMPTEFLKLLRAAAETARGATLPQPFLPIPVQLVTEMRPGALGGFTTEIAKH
jgi:hypothetical protein